MPSANGMGEGRKIGWLVGMCVMLLMALLPFSSYVAALPIIQSEWGIGNTTAGVIFSAYLAGYALSALLVLPLTDRLPTRRVFIVSALVTVVGNVLFPVAAFNPIVASALRFVAGIGLVGIYMPGLRIISQEFPDRGRGAAMGLYVTAFYTANAVSLLATGGLMNHLDWRTAYLALSLLSIVTIPMVLVLVRSAHSPGTGAGGRLQLSVLSDPRPRKYIIGYSLHAMELYAVRVWLPALLSAALVYRGTDVERAAITAATVGGIALGAGSVGPVMGGAISDRFGRAASAGGIFVLSGVCSLIIGWIIAAPWVVVVVLACLLGWAVSADSSIYSTALTETAPPGRLGSTMAVQAFLGFMGGNAGPGVHRRHPGHIRGSPGMGGWIYGDSDAFGHRGMVPDQQRRLKIRSERHTRPSESKPGEDSAQGLLTIRRQQSSPFVVFDKLRTNHVRTALLQAQGERGIEDEAKTKRSWGSAVVTPNYSKNGRKAQPSSPI